MSVDFDIIADAIDRNGGALIPEEVFCNVEDALLALSSAARREIAEDMIARAAMLERLYKGEFRQLALQFCELALAALAAQDGTIDEGLRLNAMRLIAGAKHLP